MEETGQIETQKGVPVVKLGIVLCLGIVIGWGMLYAKTSFKNREAVKTQVAKSDSKISPAPECNTSHVVASNYTNSDWQTSVWSPDNRSIELIEINRREGIVCKRPVFTSDETSQTLIKEPHLYSAINKFSFISWQADAAEVVFADLETGAIEQRIPIATAEYYSAAYGSYFDGKKDWGVFLMIPVTFVGGCEPEPGSGEDCEEFGRMVSDEWKNKGISAVVGLSDGRHANIDRGQFEISGDYEKLVVAGDIIYVMPDSGGLDQASLRAVATNEVPLVSLK